MQGAEDYGSRTCNFVEDDVPAEQQAANAGQA
jgi:hypothetical protein